MSQKINVGIVGTSWWVDAMYLPALAQHPQANIQAICGRRSAPTLELAKRWHIPKHYLDFAEMLSAANLDAVIIASANATHYPMTVQALKAGLHVLCEKPLALSYAQAKEMADLAEALKLKHMTPFTYRYMPTSRYLKELIDQGYLGQPYHLNLRYYTGFGRSEGYLWRFDKAKAGTGAIGDIGSHFLYLAYWFFGDISGLYARLGTHINRPASDPEGRPYEQADDNAMIILDFASGAQGVIHASTVAYEASAFGQIHQMEFHGSSGSLHSVTDWDSLQQVSGAKLGEGPCKVLEIPEHIWQGARRDSVHNSYKDVFRKQNSMARAFINAIAEDKPLEPSFHEGAYVQKLIETALISHSEQRWVNLKELTPD